MLSADFVQLLVVIASVLLVVGITLAHYLASFGWFQKLPQGTQSSIMGILSLGISGLTFFVIQNGPSGANDAVQKLVAAIIAFVATYGGQAITHYEARRIGIALYVAKRT
jgi:hypothetical protein